MIQFHQNELLLNDRKIQFDYPIREIVEFESLYVIMLQDGFSPDNNIVAYDKNGNKVWSIEEVIHFSYNESYVVLGKAGDNMAYVISFNGVEFVFNVYTREIVEKRITKQQDKKKWDRGASPGPRNDILSFEDMIGSYITVYEVQKP